MSFGFAVKNQNGDLQIDDIYRNLYLWEMRQASFTVPPNAGQDPVYINLLSPTNGESLVAFRSSSWMSCVPSRTNGVFDRLGCYTTEPVGTVITFDYIVYSSELILKTENFGLKVFDAAGAVAFDSRNWPARIVDIVSMTVLGSFSHAATDPYYLIPGTIAATCESVGCGGLQEGTPVFTRLMIRNTGNSSAQIQEAYTACIPEICGKFANPPPWGGHPNPVNIFVFTP